MKRYVSLINIGGDYCGMGLADSYPDFDYEDSCGQSRASNDEWVVAGAAAARIEALERENARLRDALIEVADTLEFQYRGVNPPMDRWLHDPKSAILRAKEALA